MSKAGGYEAGPKPESGVPPVPKGLRRSRRDFENFHYCGSPIDFYGCPKHGTDCYNPPYPDIGQPCGGFECNGHDRVCDDCGHEIDEWRRSNEL